LCLGEIAENCYIVPCSENSAIVVDPGSDCDEILYLLNSRNLTAIKIFLTHGHFDHIMAVSDLVKETGAVVYIHNEDKDCLTDTYRNLYSSFCGTGKFKEITNAVFVEDNDIITQGEYEFRVLHTPGHSPGSSCFLCEKGKVLFSGDTLFKGSVGNTSFPFSDYKTLMESLKKIAALEGDYRVYPGHGSYTTLEYEKLHNIFLSGINEI